MTLPRKLRRQANLGLRETARRMGISHVFLRDMERSNRAVSEEMRVKYLSAISKPNAEKAAR